MRLAISGSGAGVLTLAGSKPHYSGGTTLNAGTLVLANGEQRLGPRLGHPDAQRRHAGRRPGRRHDRRPGDKRAAAGHTIAPGAGLLRGYGTLNLNGGLTTSANTTLFFNLQPDAPSAGSIYGGDLINLWQRPPDVGAEHGISFVSIPTPWAIIGLSAAATWATRSATSCRCPRRRPATSIRWALQSIRAIWTWSSNRS